ncbi:MAG: peptidylprolyl isomerase [Candidatus Margulisiibacteriota bacterium]
MNNTRWAVAILLIGALLVGSAAEGKKKMNKQYAVLETSLGKIVCELLPKEAPATVKNFIGLAKGERGWLDPKTQEIEKKPLYNGTIFHRVIPDFMVQGGDPLGNGTGGPGYKFDDEAPQTTTFDKPGRLAMANSGPNTNGSQFFITIAPTPWLDGKHTIFGLVVKGQDIADKIATAPRDERDRPKTEIVLKKVTILDKLP